MNRSSAIGGIFVCMIFFVYRWPVTVRLIRLERNEWKWKKASERREKEKEKEEAVRWHARWQERKKNAQVLWPGLVDDNCRLVNRMAVNGFLLVGVQEVSKRELHSGITPLSRTTLSQGQGQQSYTDSPRVRDKPRGCRQSKRRLHTRQLRFHKDPL